MPVLPGLDVGRAVVVSFCFYHGSKFEHHNSLHSGSFEHLTWSVKDMRDKGVTLPRGPSLLFIDVVLRFISHPFSREDHICRHRFLLVFRGMPLAASGSRLSRSTEHMEMSWYW